MNHSNSQEEAIDDLEVLGIVERAVQNGKQQEVNNDVQPAEHNEEPERIPGRQQVFVFLIVDVFALHENV